MKGHQKNVTNNFEAHWKKLLKKILQKLKMIEIRCTERIQKILLSPPSDTNWKLVKIQKKLEFCPSVLKGTREVSSMGRSMEERPEDLR